MAAVAVMSVLVGACTGGPAATTTTAATPTSATPPLATSTTAAPAPTSTAAPTTTAGAAASTTAALSEDAKACVEVMHDWIRDIEDNVAAVDFDTVGFQDYQLFLVQIVPGLQALVDDFQKLGCMAIQEAIDPSSVDMIAWAEQNAPGAVPYLELQKAAGGYEVVGDCISDVDALQAYVDRGGTVMDLTVDERIHSYNLAGAIIQWCSLEVGERFVSSQAVSAFLAIED